jgi:type IV pilus assembly protein PilA
MLARIRKAQEENEGGFTLIELLVVIIIIGILAAIAIPTFLNQRQKGYDSQAKSDLKNIATLQETFLTDTGVYATTLSGGTGSAAGTLYYRKSPNVALAVSSFVNAAGTVVTPANDAERSVGFCASAASDSGKTWYYNSVKGGLLPATATAC